MYRASIASLGQWVKEATHALQNTTNATRMISVVIVGVNIKQTMTMTMTMCLSVACGQYGEIDS